jgi:hypothetical protein
MPVMHTRRTIEDNSTHAWHPNFDFSALIGYAPDEVDGEKELLETPNYKITDKDGTFSYSGTLSKNGLTQRIYSPEENPLIAWLTNMINGYRLGRANQ